MITTIEDEDLGPLKMQNLIFRMGSTPGAIRHGGRRLGQDTDAVLDELLGISGDKLDELREKRGRLMDRSYLFAPGHNAKLLDRVFRRRRRRGDAGPGGRGTAAGEGDGARDGRGGAARPAGLGQGQRRPDRLVRSGSRCGRRPGGGYSDPQGGIGRATSSG